MAMRKRIVAVCDDETNKYGAYLQQLVSAIDDVDGAVVGTKDGTVDVVVWDEKNFEGNMKTLSAHEHILFMGNGSLAKERRGTMEEKYSNMGMSFGWLGAQAYLYVEEGSLNAGNYPDFKVLCDKYGKAFEKELNLKYNPNKQQEEVAVEKKQKAGFLPLAFAAGVADAIAGGARAVAGAAADIVDKGNDFLQSRDALEQQYSLLTLIFYMDAINEFLGD